MMANSEDNAELRARVMASLKKFEKIPENVSTTQNQHANSSNGATRTGNSEETEVDGSGANSNSFKKKRYKFARPNQNNNYGYGASSYNQRMVPNAYNQTSYYSQYPPYMNQSSQSSYAYPMMMGAPQPYMIPQQPFAPTVPMDNFNPMYGGRMYPNGPSLHFEEENLLHSGNQNHHPSKEKKIRIQNILQRWKTASLPAENITMFPEDVAISPDFPPANQEIFRCSPAKVLI